MTPKAPLPEDQDLADHAVRNGNDMAFPMEGGSNVPAYGLTKRELFAAMAMQGAMHALAIQADEFDEPVDPYPIARDAVKMADALLKELAR